MPHDTHTQFWAYITLYALTTGIKRVRVRDCFDVSPKMVAEVDSMSVCYHSPHWHRTPEEALAQAEKMRLAAIASAEKRIKSLRSLTFTVEQESSDAP